MKNTEKSLPNYIYVDSRLKPTPYIKWVGGKRQLLNEIIPLLPESYNNYIEPFFGGGALFFYLSPTKAIINDANNQLINSLNIIKNNVLELIKILDEFSYCHNEEFYYKNRKLLHCNNDIQRAAIFIYLNKTCFNGMYRVNKKDEFNVPYNKNNNPRLYSHSNLMSISNLLNNRKIKIFNFDFSKILLKAKDGDFIFIDPPYDTESNQFTTYTKNGFDRKQQEELADLLDHLSSKNIKWMMTNNPTTFICQRYKLYFFKRVEANRSINSNASNRFKSSVEIIITNYENKNR